MRRGPLTPSSTRSPKHCEAAARWLSPASGSSPQAASSRQRSRAASRQLRVCPRGPQSRPSSSFEVVTLNSMAAVVTTHFADRLAEAVEHKRSQLVVGLDPRPDLLPVELKGEAHLGRAEAAAACGRFCRGLVDAVAPYVVGVKPQVAFFEALGADGFRAFEEACAYARAAELLVIADGKRGDVGSTARAYASAYLERGGERPPLADALTV